MNTKCIGLTFVMVLLSGTVFAASPQWVAFDSAFPQDFVDTQSIVHISKDVVRFWDRGGAFPNGDGPGAQYPQYTLSEINCETHMSRTIRWDLALEAGVNASAARARAEFTANIAQLQLHYPTEWESLEPSQHEYALLEFVCRKRN